MIVASPYAPLLLRNAGSSQDLLEIFLFAMRAQKEKDSQRIVQNRYQHLYGAIFNLMTEYFIQGFASNPLRDSFRFGYLGHQNGFSLSIRPVMGGKEDISSLHERVYGFVEDIDYLSEKQGLDFTHNEHGSPDIYSGKKIYMFEWGNISDVIKLCKTISDRLNAGREYDESALYAVSSFFGNNEGTPIKPLSQSPLLYEGIQLAYDHARGITRERGDGDAPTIGHHLIQ